MFYIIILFVGSMDFSDINFRHPDRNEIIRQRVSSKVRQLLGDRKVNELSLEEALKFKKLYDLADWRKGGEGAGWGDEHIESLYEIEAAGEFVKALKLAYKRQGKLRRDIEELKALLTESEQQIYRDREGARSRMFGIGSGLDIKKLEEGMMMMLDELNQKQAEEKRILEEEAPKLQLQIKRLKEEYLSSDLPKQMKQVAHEALRSELAAERAAAAAARAAAEEAESAKKAAGWGAYYAKMKQSSEAMEPESALADASFAATMAAATRDKHSYLRAKRDKNRAEKAAKNAAEQKAVRNLNARESERAANLIFPRQNHTRRKPTWGIPNVGPGFGGSRKRRRSRKIERITPPPYKHKPPWDNTTTPSF